MHHDPYVTNVVLGNVRGSLVQAHTIRGSVHINSSPPDYLLTSHSPAKPDQTLADGVPTQPSYLLNARSAVVDFTGRQTEIAELFTWCDSDHRLAARWMHAPGGQGKTRLATHFGDRCLRLGWKVLVADHTAGTVAPHTEPDLDIGTATGLLLIVDYADRWPLPHLMSLFSNEVLGQVVPVRVLLLARTAHVWSSLRHALIQAGWPAAACSVHRLDPLSDSRTAMFTTARDSFARCYQLPDASTIPVPAELERDDFGLTLTVHMAALVAVDRHANAATQPSLDMTGLTAYLLEREHHHWSTGVDLHPDLMSRAVFTAALTGPLQATDAKTALNLVGVGADADRVLNDHAFCYPPIDQRTFLEPLYPDRLAEDFLALCLPGHEIPGQWAKPWAYGASNLLLSSDDQVLPPYASRAITFLSAAAERWPHLIETLESIQDLLPDDPTEVGHGELAVAATRLVELLSEYRLASTTTPAERAETYYLVGIWLDHANRSDEAATALREATAIYRQLATTAPRAFEFRLAEASFALAMSLVHLGLTPDEQVVEQSTHAILVSHRTARPDEALASFREAIEILRRLARTDPMEYEERLCTAMAGVAFLGPHLGRRGEVVEFARDADELAHQLARQNRGDWANSLHYTLMTLAATLAEEEPARAEELACESVGLARQAANTDPAEHGDLLSMVLTTQAAVLLRLGKPGEALNAVHEAVVEDARYRRPLDGSEYRDSWSNALPLTLAEVFVHASADYLPTGLTATLGLLRRLVRDIPEGAGPALRESILALTHFLTTVGRWEDVLSAHRLLLDVLRSSDDLQETTDDLIDNNDSYGVLLINSVMLASLGKWKEALTTLNETAADYQAHEPFVSLENCLTSVLYGFVQNMVNIDSADTVDFYEKLAQPQATVILNQVAAAYRRLAQENPAEHEHGYAVTVKILSETLWRLGETEEAVAAGREAVEMRRRLAQHTTTEHLDQLALALRYLADKLLALRKYEKAAAAAQEAADIRRQMALDDPARQARPLAAVLHLAATSLRWVRPQDGVAPATEAAAILSRLADEDPEEHAQAYFYALENRDAIIRMLD